MAAPGAFRSTIVLDARQRVGQRARFTGTVRVDSVHADPPSPSPWLARRRRRTVGRTAGGGSEPVSTGGCIPHPLPRLPSLGEGDCAGGWGTASKWNGRGQLPLRDWGCYDFFSVQRATGARQPG